MSGIIESKFGYKFPKSWMELPADAGMEPLTVDPDTGRARGMVALRNTCHKGYAGECKTPPFELDYDEFNHGSGGHVYVYGDDPAEVERASVGVITALGGHEGGSRRITSSREMNKAMAEDLAVQAMVGRAYPTKDGIYFAGAAWPGTSPEIISRGIAGRPSGDWRSVLRIRNMKLLGIHLVNDPGYPTGEQLAASSLGEDDLPYVGIDGGMVFYEDEPREEGSEMAERLVASTDSTESEGCGGTCASCSCEGTPVTASATAGVADSPTVSIKSLGDDGSIILEASDGTEYRGSVSPYSEPAPLTIVGLKKMQDYEKKVFED